jgi:hypothetical protein
VEAGAGTPGIVGGYWYNGATGVEEGNEPFTVEIGLSLRGVSSSYHGAFGMFGYIGVDEHDRGVTIDRKEKLFGTKNFHNYCLKS